MKLPPLPPCSHCGRTVDRAEPKVLYGVGYVHLPCLDALHAACPPRPYKPISHASEWS